MSIPDEITHRNGRIDKLKQARQIIEERHAEEIKAKQQEYEEKKAKRDQQRQQGKKLKGKDPQPLQVCSTKRRLILPMKKAVL